MSTCQRDGCGREAKVRSLFDRVQNCTWIYYLCDECDKDLRVLPAMAKTDARFENLVVPEGDFFGQTSLDSSERILIARKGRAA
jgi:hypothetical protein